MTPFTILKSAPAQKLLPVPVSMTARELASSRNDMTICSNSLNISSLMGLRFSGRFNVTSAIVIVSVHQEVLIHLLASPVPTLGSCRLRPLSP